MPGLGGHVDALSSRQWVKPLRTHRLTRQMATGSKNKVPLRGALYRHGVEADGRWSWHSMNDVIENFF